MILLLKKAISFIKKNTGYSSSSLHGNTQINTAWMNGDKFDGGFGDTQLLDFDYWTLRERSTQLYNENLYAQGIINCLVTNIINSGLILEATPIDEILEKGDDFLNDWSD